MNIRWTEMVTSNYKKNKHTDIKIVLQDFHGNESELSFKIISTAAQKEADQIQAGNYLLSFNERNIIRLPNADIVFDEASFVDNKLIEINESLEIVDDQTLPSFNIGDQDIPMFKSFKLFIKGLSIPDSLKPNFCLVKCDEKTKTAYRGNWQDSLYVVELNSLGQYQCSFDLTKPEIKAINLKSDMSNQAMIRFKITDNFEPASKKDRLKYSGKIDGHWVLFEYDLKKDLIFYQFDNNCLPGEHKLTLTVSDNRGNESTSLHHFTKF